MSWSLAGSAQVRDVSAVVTHELGHALGLIHPCEPSGQGGAPDCDAAGPSIEGATMFPLYDPDQASLAEDDAAGMCSLYPETAPCGGCPDQKVCRAGECVAIDPDGVRPDAGCVGMSCEDDTACGSLASCVEGTCRRGTGQLGDRCAASADCDHGVCVGGFCQPECNAAVSCAHGDCREALEPALSGCVESREYPVGASCRTADDCTTGLCVSLGDDDSRCTQTCAPDGSCPEGWGCTAIDGRDVCVTRAFTASGGAGCALSSRSDTTGPLWVLGLTVAVCGWRRRKNSIQRGGG